jgi:hypothetical protein
MRNGTRKILLGVGLLLASAAGTALSAQCMGCSSSHACASSTTRGGCKVLCVGTGCACGDNACGPSGKTSGTNEAAPNTQMLTYQGPGAVVALSAEVFAVVDCQGNFATLAYTPERAETLERGLATIALTPSPRPALAARARTALPERSDE